MSTEHTPGAKVIRGESKTDKRSCLHGLLPRHLVSYAKTNGLDKKPLPALPGPPIYHSQCWSREDNSTGECFTSLNTSYFNPTFI